MGGGGVEVRSLKPHFDLCAFVLGCKFKTARSGESAVSAVTRQRWQTADRSLGV